MRACKEMPSVENYHTECEKLWRCVCVCVIFFNSPQSTSKGNFESFLNVASADVRKYVKKSLLQCLELKRPR